MLKFIKISLCFSAFFLLFHLASAATLDVTNAEKLSLDPTTPIGQKVRVSDGFVISGAGTDDVNGFWYPIGTAGGKPQYAGTLDYGNTGRIITWNTGFVTPRWEISDSSGNYTYISTEDVAYPWLVTTWTLDFDGVSPLPTLTHPAIQQLTAPSADQIAVFISGAGTAEANGIYTERGQNSGKAYYNLIGHPDDINLWSIVWDNSVGNGWALTTDGNDSALYVSMDNVEFPWLVTWTVNNGSSPAPTSSAITQGELDAGVTVAGASLSAFNLIYPVTSSWAGDSLGYQYDYSPDNFSHRVTFSGDGGWSVQSFDTYRAENQNSPFPWDLTYSTGVDGTPPAPTITRNDVVSEANWEVTTDDIPDIESPSSGGGHHSSSHGAIPPATTSCRLGDNFSSTTGLPCTSFTTPTVCPIGHLFSAITGLPCTSFTIPATGSTSSLQASGGTPSPTCTITSTLGLGWYGSEVKCLQTILNDSLKLSPPLSIDGIFGPKTKAAVIAFQIKNRLTPDGIVGPLTRAKFQSR